jgi:hypothetical protein
MGRQNFRFPVFREAGIRANGLERVESAQTGHAKTGSTTQDFHVF